MSIGTQTLNARSETVTTKPAFRDPILKKRCLIPADGFYEWKRVAGGKEPYYIHRRDGKGEECGHCVALYVRDGLTAPGGRDSVDVIRAASHFGRSSYVTRSVSLPFDRFSVTWIRPISDVFFRCVPPHGQ